MNVQIKPCGDRALVVMFKQEINEKINQQVINLMHQINRLKLQGIVEMIPAYSALTVLYLPEKIFFIDLATIINDLLEKHEEVILKEPLTHEIPVRYGGVYGPDLRYVADYHQMDVAEVVERHTRPIYRVYMLGFTPGFPYLGGLDKSISTPRLKTPRMSIPIGSVGIAGDQTGIYPIESPGGWQIIGQTDVSLFNLSLKKPFLLNPGDLLKFVAVSVEGGDNG